MKTKSKPLSKETKATLDILIHQIQEILSFPYLRLSQLEYRINSVLNDWIKANDLHPEEVITIQPSSTNAYTLNTSRWDITTNTDGQWHTINVTS